MLRLKPGDRVKIMDDTLVYTVVSHLSGGNVLVRTDDGLELPLKAGDLIKAVIKPENLSFNGSVKNEKTGAALKKGVSVKHERRRDKEVDLHFSGSCTGATGLTTVELQLLRFRSELDRAIRDGYGEITFIHGVGTGILKQELRKALSNNYPSLSYQDASFSKYGYGGATLILINKKKI